MRSFAEKQNQPGERVSSGFARSVQRLLPTHANKLQIQPKLTVNATGNVYEQEADRVAEQVMRMPEPRQQLTCPCGGSCPRCQAAHSDREQLQIKAARNTINLSAAPRTIYRQRPLVEPPIVTEFREVGQLVPPAAPGLTAPPNNQPVNVTPPTARPEPAPTPSPSPPSGPSPQLVYFLMRHEGFYAHPDDVSDAYNCTVGYGNKLHHGTCVGNQSEDHPDFAAIERRFARGITQEQGLATLIRRLMRDTNYLLQHLTVPVSQNQFDALLSFAFNPGGGLGSVIAHINSGEYAAVPGIMLRFAGAGTTEGHMAHPRGLGRRRAEEAAMWERGDYGHGTAYRHHGCRRMIEDCSNPEHPRPRVVTPPEQQ